MGLIDANPFLDDCISIKDELPFEMEKVKIKLKANKWYFRKQKVDVDIPPDAIIYVQPDIENEENHKAFVISYITCVKHETDKIIFKAKKKPFIDINVMLCFLRFK